MRFIVMCLFVLSLVGCATKYREQSFTGFDGSKITQHYNKTRYGDETWIDNVTQKSPYGGAGVGISGYGAPYAWGAPYTVPYDPAGRLLEERYGNPPTVLHVEQPITRQEVQVIVKKIKKIDERVEDHINKR